MKLRIYFTLLILFVISATGFSQPMDEALKNATLEEKYDAATRLMDVKQYFQALKIWKNILTEFPDNANYNYQAGICYLNINLDKANALPHLEKAKTNISKNSNPFDAYEDRVPVDVYFYLGQGYHIAQQFDKAIEMFNKFRAEANKKHQLQKEVDHQIAWANNAKYETENPRQKNANIYNIGKGINSEASDYSPVLSLDEKLLFFTSRRIREDSMNLKQKLFVPQDGKLYEDIYFSIFNRETNEWGKPELASLSELRKNEATISVSADGLQLFLYRDDDGNGNIYYADFADTAFGELMELGSDINSDSWETHVTLTADGNTLYFVSDRPGGLGGRDIYRCVKLPNGEWSKALNVGPPINTPYDEDAPFISAGGRYLYYSSNSDKSMGGFDIFISEFTEDGTFSAPVPIGVPINSVDDDVFFITNVSGTRGYFSSFRSSDTYGEKDIYVIELDTVQVENIAILRGYIVPPKGQSIPENLLIYVYDLTEGSEPDVNRVRPQDGSYIFALIPCHEYMVDYQIDGSTFHQYQFQVPCGTGYQELDKVLILDDINMGGKDSIPFIDTSHIEKDTSEYMWHVQIKGLPVNKENMVAEYLDKNGKVIYSEPIDNDGNFRYRPLAKDQSYIFQVKSNGKPLCDELEVVLLDKDKKTIGKTVRDERCKLIYQKDKDTATIVEPISASPVDYDRFYRYNKKGITSDDKKYKKLVDGIAKLVKANGVAYVEIESSASKVPTSTYKTNENLAKLRLEDAKNKLMASLKAKGVDVSKVKIASETSLVLGPDYNDDWVANRETYEKYQYIKIKAR